MRHLLLLLLLVLLPSSPLLSCPLGLVFAFSVPVEGNKARHTLRPWQSSTSQQLGALQVGVTCNKSAKLCRETRGTLFVANGGDNDSLTKDRKNETVFQGRSLLCLVALLYGTLNVSLRLVYQLPDPPSAAAISMTRGWLAVIAFLPLLLIPSQQNTTTKSSIARSGAESTGSFPVTPLLVAALELAIWNGLAQGLLNAGLLSTGSARASFLTQTSVLFTPVISILAGQSIAKGTWAGCAIALVGLLLLSGGTGLALAFSVGDYLVLGGALAWSSYLLRLSQIGSRFNEIQLQFFKTILLAFLYSTWFLTGFSGGDNLLSQMATSMKWTMGPGALAAWIALLFSAVGPGIAADVLQQQGQRSVSASEANVLLSMEPVFAAVFARLLLGEVTTLTENVGGGLIVIAALITAITSNGNSSSSNDDNKDIVEPQSGSRTTI